MQLLELLRKTTERLEKFGIDDALADAELIVFHAAGTDRLNAYMNNPEASPSLIAKVKRMTRRRLEGEPVQYLVGYVEFLNLKIHVGKGVLIPRPETELLVEEVINTVNSSKTSVSGNIFKTENVISYGRHSGLPGIFLQKDSRQAGVTASRRTSVRQERIVSSPITHNSSLSLLDLCTGSGCIALALAKALPAAMVYGTDISNDALRYARKNAKANSITNIKFLHGPLFEPVKNRKFDLITANPPYIRKDEIETLQREIRDWEPVTALDGGDDGLNFYREILSEAGAHLNTGGWIFLELGYDQAAAVTQIAKASGFRDVQVINDYAGIGRILKARYP